MAIIELSKDEAKKRLRAEISAMQTQSNKPAQPTQATSYNDIATQYEQEKKPWFIERSVTNLWNEFMAGSKDLADAIVPRAGTDELNTTSRVVKWVGWFARALASPITWPLSGAAQSDNMLWTWLTAVWGALWAVADVWTDVIVGWYNPTIGRVTGEIQPEVEQNLTDALTTFVPIKWKIWKATGEFAEKVANSKLWQSAKSTVSDIKQTANTYAPWMVNKAEWAYSGMKNIKNAVTDNSIYRVASGWAKWMVDFWLNAAFDPIGWTFRWVKALKDEFSSNIPQSSIDLFSKATGKTYWTEDIAGAKSALQRVVQEHPDIIPDKGSFNIKSYTPMVEKIDSSIDNAKEVASQEFAKAFPNMSIRQLRDTIMGVVDEYNWIVPSQAEKIKASFGDVISEKALSKEWFWKADVSVTSDVMSRLYKMLDSDDFKVGEKNIWRNIFKETVNRIDPEAGAKAISELNSMFDMINLKKALDNGIKKWEGWVKDILTALFFWTVQWMNQGKWNIAQAASSLWNFGLAAKQVFDKKWIAMKRAISEARKEWLANKSEPVKETSKKDWAKETSKETAKEDTFEKKQYPKEERYKWYKVVKEKVKEAEVDNWATYTQKKKWLVDKPEKQKSKAQIDREFQAYQKKKIEDEAKAKKDQKVNRGKATKWLNELEKLVDISIKKAEVSWKQKVIDIDTSLARQKVESLKWIVKWDWIKKLNSILDDIDNSKDMSNKAKVDKYKKIKWLLSKVWKWTLWYYKTFTPAQLSQINDEE